MDTNTNNTQNTMGHSQCSKRDALWLCWFGGLFGAHRDLAGRKGGGCLFLLCWVAALACLIFCPPVFFFWLAFCIIWWLVDLFTLIAGKYRDGDGRLLYTTDNGHYSSSDVYTTLASPFGIHRFYAGLTGSATIMLVVSILALVIVIIERILRAIIKTLLCFTDSDASDAGACGLSTLGTIVGGYFLLPLLKGYEALIVLMTIGYVGFIVMSIWAFVDFVRGLFGKVENGYGHIMLEDQEELYQLRLKDWNACMGIAAPTSAALPATPPALPKASQASPAAISVKQPAPSVQPHVDTPSSLPSPVSARQAMPAVQPASPAPTLTPAEPALPAQPAPTEPGKPAPAPQPQAPAGQPALSPLLAESARMAVKPSSSGIGSGTVISVLLLILMLVGAGIGWCLYTQHQEETRLAMEAEQKAQQKLKDTLERERQAKEKALREQQQLQANLKQEELQKQRALQREQEIQERLAAERRRADAEAAARREAEQKRAEQEAAAQLAAQARVSSKWDAAINSLSARTFSDDYSQLLQRRLLSALKSIRNGGNVNDVIPNANGTTALHNACGLGEYEIVQLLLENGADVSLKTAKGASVRTCVGNDPSGRIDALIRRYEAANGSVSSSEDRSDLQPLIDRMARLKCKQAISAYQQGYLLRMLPQILDGADVDMTTSDSGGHTALHYAVGIGSLSITKWLVNHGANVNARADNGDTPLGSVGQDNRDAIIKLLRDHGASEGGSTYTPSPSPYNGYRGDLQPMIDRMAALRCREESSKLYQRRLLMLLPMIRDGADVNMTTLETKGNTALHYAVAIGSLSITRWLLEHGANPNAVTDKGASVMQCVGSDNHQQITSLLRQYGAY